MVIRRRPRRLRLARTTVATVVSLWLLTMFAPRDSYAIAPDIREVTPAGIVIDEASDDWDSPQLDFMALMFEAGKPEKDVLANAYGRYDCGTETFYIHVVAVPGWNILPSDADNYVKLGQRRCSFRARPATTDRLRTSPTWAGESGRRRSI